MKATSIILIGIMVLMSGCGTMGNSVDATKIALAYYSQERICKSFDVQGASEITFKGENMSFTIANQMPVLSLYPRDPSALATTFTGLGKIAAIVGASYVGNTLAAAATNPTIVTQPAPLVVRPEIVTP